MAYLKILQIIFNLLFKNIKKNWILKEINSKKGVLAAPRHLKKALTPIVARDNFHVPESEHSGDKKCTLNVYNYIFFGIT